MEERQSEVIEALKTGNVPMDSETLKRLTVGMDPLTGFLKKRYLEEYISCGGSKIRFVTGRKGSGKTHFVRIVMDDAKEENYLTVFFSAKDVWLHDFKDIYLEILRQCDIERVLEKCANKIITELGYDPSMVADGQTFMDSLSERGEADPFARGEIRSALREYFTRNSMLDNNFANCCALLTGGLLGHPVLETSGREKILAFLNGDKTVKLSQLRALGLSPSRITKYNARYQLRSLAEVIHLSGYAGLVIVIDDMEQLLNRSADNGIRYTKLRRDDTYESIRQLIDDIDNMRHMLFLFCFDRELMDNDSYGMKSYQALWMRIQNEVVSTRFNHFADIVDMDRYGDEYYNEKMLCEMADRLADFMKEKGVEAKKLDAEDAAQLETRAQFGGLGLPYLVNRYVIEEGKQNV